MIRDLKSILLVGCLSAVTATQAFADDAPKKFNNSTEKFNASALRSDRGNNDAYAEIPSLETPQVFDEFDDRFPGCNGTACIGSVSLPLIVFGGGYALPSDFGSTHYGQFFQTGFPNVQADSKIANNFTPTVSGDITELCFIGFYTYYPLNTTDPGFSVLPPTTRTFRISYYRDVDGKPCGIPMASFIVGATNPTPGTDFAQQRLSTNSARHRFVTTHPAVHVESGSCYWVEIVDVDPTLDGVFRWLHTPPAYDDDNHEFLAIVPFTNALAFSSYTPQDVPVDVGDAMFCINVGSNPYAIGCSSLNPLPPSPPNDSIFAAQLLTPGAPEAGTLDGATVDFDTVRPCGFAMGDGAGVWYKFLGTGTQLTVSTENSSNCTDTQMIVYDADAYLLSNIPGDLACIGSNDDAGPYLGSAVSFCTVPGKNYYVYIQGVDQGVALASGPFTITLTDDGACSTPYLGTICDVTMQPGDQLTSEFCGTRTNDGCTADTANSPLPEFISVGGPAVFADCDTISQTSRDRDAYNFSLAQDTDIDWYLNAEFPAYLVFYSCTGTAPYETYAGAAYAVPTCTTESIARLSFPAGDWMVRVLPTAFGGIDTCGSAWNNYRLQAVVAPIGACCFGTTCYLNTQVTCQILNGRFIGDNSTCDTSPCTPLCDVISDGAIIEDETCAAAEPLLDLFTPNGGCNFATQSITLDGQPIFGTLVTNGANTDLDFYLFSTAEAGSFDLNVNAESHALSQIVTCPDETPVTQIFSFDSCSTTAQLVADLPAGDYAVIVALADFGGAPCDSGVNDYLVSIAPNAPAACPGDFNGDQAVTVSDIFAFLNAWFAQFLNCSGVGNCSADINGSGTVEVADIFAFLNQWFSHFGIPCP